MTVPLDRETLTQRLWGQIDLSDASVRSSDEGTLIEARRIAVGMRVLLHDTQRSKSLLGLLSMKHELNYKNTAIAIDPRNRLTTAGLIHMRFETRRIGKHR